MKKFSSLVLAAVASMMVATANAGILYTVNDSTNQLVSIDTSTLVRTTIGATGVGGDFGGMAYDPVSDTLYWIPGRGNNNLYKLNRLTGVATLIGAHGINDLFGLEFDTSTGTLYGTRFVAGAGFYRLNTSTGAATVINAGMRVGIGGLAFDSTRNQLVGINDGSGQLYSINRSNGVQTLLASPGNNDDSGFAYDYNNDIFYDIDWSGNLFKYNPITGYARTTLLSGLGRYDGLAYVGTPIQGNVPEPESFALFGLALACLCLTRRKPKQA